MSSAFGLLIPWLCFAQAQPDPAIRVNVNLIQIDLTVTDRTGKRVPGLRPEDFEVFRDGKRQAVKDLIWVEGRTGDKPDLPGPIQPHQVRRTIALVLDDLTLSFESLHYARKAMHDFVEQNVQPGDLVALYRSSSGIGMLQQLSSDKQQLLRQIDAVNLRNAIAVNGLVGNPTSTGRNLAELAMEQQTRDQVQNRERQDLLTASTLFAVTTIVDGFRELPGRKSLVLFSEGLQLADAPMGRMGAGAVGMLRPTTIPGSRFRTVQAIQHLADRANRAEVVIYTIDPRGVAETGLDDMQFSDSNATIQQGQIRLPNSRLRQWQDGVITLAEQTGGIAYRNNNDLHKALQDALDDQQGYYLLSFVPDDDTFEKIRDTPKYNRVTVKAKRSGLRLRYRQGFYGVSDDEDRQSLDPLITALISPFRSTALALKLTPLFLSDDAGKPVVRVLVHFDVNKLQFVPEAADQDDPNQQPWMLATIDQLVFVFDSTGKRLNNYGRTHTLKLRGEPFQQARSHGMTQELEMPMPGAGPYQLRAAVRQQSSGLIGSAMQFLEIPNLGQKSLQLSSIVLNGNSFTTGEDILAGPATRSIRAGDLIEYGAMIYNPLLSPDTRSLKLEMQVSLVKDGKLVFVDKQLPLAAGQVSPGSPLSITGSLKLSSQTPPGEYVLQLAVSDLANPRKPRYALRSTDFVIR